MFTPWLLAPFVLLSSAAATTSTKPPPTREEMMQAMAQIAASHIEGNVPAEADFMPFLQRDVRAWLAADGKPADALRIELLRKGPTQVGLSYPKYYLWVSAADSAGQRVEGAMQVAAVDRVGFRVGNFTPATAVRADRSILAATYPAMLIPAIQKRAGS